MYPGTSGAAFIDYLVTDRVVTPPEQQHLYTEKLVFMPWSYQVNHYTDQSVQRADSHMRTTSAAARPDAHTSVDGRAEVAEGPAGMTTHSWTAV